MRASVLLEEFVKAAHGLNAPGGKHDKALELDPSSAGAKKTLKEVGMSLMLHADSDDEDSD